MWNRLEEEEDGVKRLLNVVTHKTRPCIFGINDTDSSAFLLLDKLLLP